MSVESDIQQLKAQQALQTEALKAALEGRWTGSESVEAYLLALNPTFQLVPNPPKVTRRT